MALRVDDQLLQYMRESSGAVHIEVRGTADVAMAVRGLRRARGYLFLIPHPDQGDEPYCSFASEVEVGPSGPRFWFDMADAEAYDGVVEAALRAVLIGLHETGVRDGVVTRAGCDPGATTPWEPDADERFADALVSFVERSRDPTSRPPTDQRDAGPDYRQFSGWARHASLPTERSFLGAVCGADGLIYAIGGETTRPVRTVEIYDPEMDAWRQGPSLGIARRGPGVTLGRDGRIYAVGGYDSERKGLTTAEVLSTDSGRWQPIAPLGDGFRNHIHACTGPDGRIYALASEWYKDFAVYDPDLDAWTRLDSPAINPSVAVGGKDGRIFIFSELGAVLRPGEPRKAEVGDGVRAAVYSPLEDEWAEAPAPHCSRFGFGVTRGRQGHLFVFGGQRWSSPIGGFTLVPTVERYDPETERWFTEGPMPTPRAYVSTTVDSVGRLFVIGGVTVESYNPS